LYFTGIDVTIQYGANDQGYLGASQQTFPATNQPNQTLKVDEINSFNIPISLRESASANSDDGIASIKATIPAAAGFSGSQITSVQITSVSPSLPISFSPGSLIAIKLKLIAPGYSTGQNCAPEYCSHGEYYGPKDLVITTTTGS
jgi:hypothetical protein